MPGYPWTADEEVALRVAVAEGATCAECAEELGRSYLAVMQKCSRLHLKFASKGPPANLTRDLLIVATVATGGTMEDAARRLGVRSGALVHAIRRLLRAGALVRTGTRVYSYRVPTAWKKSGGRAGAKKHYHTQDRSGGGQFGGLRKAI